MTARGSGTSWWPRIAAVLTRWWQLSGLEPLVASPVSPKCQWLQVTVSPRPSVTRGGLKLSVASQCPRVLGGFWWPQLKAVLTHGWLRRVLVSLGCPQDLLWGPRGRDSPGGLPGGALGCPRERDGNQDTWGPPRILGTPPDFGGGLETLGELPRTLGKPLLSSGSPPKPRETPKSWGSPPGEPPRTAGTPPQAQGASLQSRM